MEKEVEEPIRRTEGQEEVQAQLVMRGTIETPRLLESEGSQVQDQARNWSQGIAADLQSCFRNNEERQNSANFKGRTVQRDQD